MGCDIHAYVELYTPGEGWEEVKDFEEPFGDRNYGWFGFLAGVRNYSRSPVIAEPRGLPEDATLSTEERKNALRLHNHSHSWLTLAELLTYDYDRVFWDRRITKNGNGAALAEEGEGEHLTLRDFLGERFFAHLDRMRAVGHPYNVRVVFWFDN